MIPPPPRSTLFPYTTLFRSDIADKLLLRNILRARDKAPMHFGDIPLIHESIQVSASLQSQILYGTLGKNTSRDFRSEEHTSELQSRRDLVCRLLLEKKKRRI